MPDIGNWSGWGPALGWTSIKHEFVKRRHARFDQEGIVIPFPIRTMTQREAPTSMPEGATSSA